MPKASQDKRRIAISSLASCSSHLEGWLSSTTEVLSDSNSVTLLVRLLLAGRTSNLFLDPVESLLKLLICPGSNEENEEEHRTVHEFDAEPLLQHDAGL
mmetsp:Transcript_8474/g.28414  ORF Transcript_8474/g.28414 Transcript_8474/m.28414 type:complete len:99 (-) Transcript_8474:280-576(-)